VAWRNQRLRSEVKTKSKIWAMSHLGIDPGLRNLYQS